jgi:hypothetical protein
VLIATTVELICLKLRITHSADVGAQEKAAVQNVLSNLGSWITSLVKGLKREKY